MPLFNQYYPPRFGTPNPNQQAMDFQSQTNLFQSNQPIAANGVIWVQGESAAKAYPVAPGNKVLLMDSETPTIYIKSTDFNGRPYPIEIYDLKKREDDNTDIKEETITQLKKEDVYLIVKEELDKFKEKLKYLEGNSYTKSKQIFIAYLYNK